MKKIIATITLLFSANCFALTGNQLHTFLQSENDKVVTGAKYYIMAAVDTINYYKVTEITLAKLDERKPDLRLFICAGDAMYSQSFDVVKNYLTQHPENRNALAIDIITTALFEVWPCPTQ